MSAADNKQKAQARAAYLKEHGIYHGDHHKTSLPPSHNNYPTNQAGSAAYRRLMAKKRKRNERLGIPDAKPKVTKSAKKKGKDYRKVA